MLIDQFPFLVKLYRELRVCVYDLVVKCKDKA